MKPNAEWWIYQTKVWTTPSYRSGAAQSTLDGLGYADTLDGRQAWEMCTMTTTKAAGQSSADEVARLRDRVAELAAANERLTNENAELRETEQALRANELNFQLTVDSMPGMVHTMTAAGAVEFVNRQILDFFGKTVEELERWDLLLHPDDRPRVVDLWTHSVATGEPFDVEVRARRADGTYRWLHSRALPLRDRNGNVVRWHNLLADIDERKRAEEALRESERETRLIVDSIPGLVATLTPVGEVEVVNPQLVEYCGQPLEAMKEWGTNGTVHPDDLPRMVPIFTQAIASGEPYDFEARIRRFDGAYRWFQVRGLPLRGSAGRIARWYVLLTDIDERKRAEDGLRASERSLKLIIDTIPAMAWSARPDGSAEFFNRHYVDFAGISAERAGNWGWTTAVHPEHLNDVMAMWQRITDSKVPGEGEVRLRRHDGEYRWFLFRANPLRDEEGNVIKWYGISTDIEDRKRAEAELRRAYDHLAEAQRLSQTGSFTSDLERDEHFWSDEFYRICGFELGSPVTIQRLGGIVHPEDAALYEGAIGRAMAGTDPDFYFRIVTSGDVVKHLRGFAHRIADRPVFVGAVQDVTASKMAQEALNKAGAELARVSRVTTMSALTASIAHEVNQPLSGIITNAGTCLRMLDTVPPDLDGARETARRTIRDGNRASDVITRLRAFFIKKEFMLEPMDLNEAIREVIALSSNDLQRHRVILHSELADGLPLVAGDRIQLQQVIVNLVRNAADAMVDVHDRPRQLLIRTEYDDGDRVRLTVRDVGTGLPPQNANALFDAFYTTKSGGMGIGLFVSRSIIERHRGRLWAEPNDGAPGATFSFTIPCDTQNRDTVSAMARA
jgi:PAS domain S-box-containing protein